METKYCKNCGGPIPFNPKYSKKYHRRKKFCSSACSNRYYNRQRRKPMPIRHCLYCGKRIIPADWDYPKNFAKRQYCNQRCNNKHRWENPEYRKRMLETIQDKERIHKQSRAMIAKWNDPEYRGKLEKEKQTYTITCPVCGETKTFEKAYASEYENICCNRKCAAQYRWEDPEIAQKHKQAMRKKWRDPEYQQAWARGIGLRPTKPEMELFNLLNSNSYNYIYTGDGSFWVGRKNPDFVCSETKTIIEMLGAYWHTEDEIKPRETYFANYGFRMLAVWDYELDNTKELLEKLKVFHSGLE